jgi:hypothetical protein
MLAKLTGDAQSEVRQTARDTVRLFSELYPDKTAANPAGGECEEAQFAAAGCGDTALDPTRAWAASEPVAAAACAKPDPAPRPQFAVGEEALFIDKIAEYIGTARPFELKVVIWQILLNLLGCAEHNDEVLAGCALSAIEVLIRELPSAFESGLYTGFRLFWRKEWSSFGFQLLAFFDPNAVLPLAVKQQPGEELLEFIASLCGRK